MPDEVDELVAAGNMCRQHGWERAAFILGKAGAEAIRGKRKPRAKAVKVRLLGGSWAMLDKARVDTATEIDG